MNRELTLVLLNPERLYPFFANSIDPDHLASSTDLDMQLFDIQYMNVSKIWIN